MKKLVWTPEFETGDAEIDEQHKGLFGFINELAAAATLDETIEALSMLYRYTRGHFAYEESVMRGVMVPKEMYRRHVREHDELTSLLDRVKASVNTGFVDSDIVLTLTHNWCRKHIPVTDKALIKYLVR